MAIQWVLVCHGLITLMVVISFLCGQWPIFQGTFVERLHNFLTFGAYEYFLKFVGKMCGDRGENAVISVEYYCCYRSNPTLQILYAAILSTTYYFIVQSSFAYIPNYYLSDIHRYISIVAIGVGVILFLLTSFSDPGMVKAENVSQYISAYPYDNVIYSERECSTCKIPKPARSKHCSVCDRCVARFDHHCGWMNNCIGERNTRYFLAFLLWHFCLCLYGSVALSLILASRLKELKIIHILTVYYGVENSFRGLAPHIAQWLLSSYNTQILLMVFLGVVCLLMAAFFGYHAKLCYTNTTTNETYKWQDHENLQRKINEAKASATALKASLNGLSAVNKPPESKWKSFFRRSPLKDAEVVVKTNIYDKGLVHNFSEVIFPLSTRSSFVSAITKKAKVKAK
ncbi:hypothetical protein RND81_09G223000 [Saponaria officinalis]|uniref:S-acyltransferase n=1 Tax=Saponaria officinalis TaxID=3572 RepID=A0AAW1IP79_SAPOF